MRITSVISFVTICGLFGLIHRYQREVDHIRLYEEDTSSRYFLPQPQVIYTASMGFHHMVAEVLWVRSILLYSDFVLSCKPDEAEWLLSMLRAIKTLDPEWRSVYFWGGTMLSLCGDIDGSDELFIDGAEAFPDDAFFPFSVAMNALNERGDRKTALKWMKVAASKENSPPWYQAAVAGLMNDGEDQTASILYLEERLKDDDLEPVIRDLTAYRLFLFRHDQYQRELEQRRTSWEMEHQQPLTNLEELGVVPADPFGQGWILAADGRIRSIELERKEAIKVVEQEHSILMRKDWGITP